MEELIEKYQKKHAALLDEYSKGNTNNEVMQGLRSHMKDILEVINDLRNLNS